MRANGPTSHAMSPSNGDLNGHAGLLGEKTPLSPTIRDRFIVVLRYLADLLRPSILTPSRGPRKALHATAYLDGLRGFAAFMVYWQHHQVWARVGLDANDIFENAWGYEDRWYFACLPFIRTFFTGGHFSVAVFFVISGFVLSNKPLALIHAGEQGKLMENLSSAMFRRWLRLYIPAVGTTFLYMTSWHAFGIVTAWPDHQKDYRAELANWWTEIRVFGWLFRGGSKLWLSYNFHLWSIPVEFRGSVIIYSTLMAVSRCTRNFRLYTLTALIFYFLYIANDGWYGAAFIAGLLICDLQKLASANNLPLLFTKYLQPYQRLIWPLAFIIAMYLGGVPAHDPRLFVLRNSPGWYYLSYMKPENVCDADYKWFYLFFASSLVVASIPHLGPLKSFFETRFCQYLGKHSFALYLVHGPVLWMLADRVYLAAGWARENNMAGLEGWTGLFPLNKTGPLGLEPAFWAPHTFILPITLYAAEITTKLFDENSVKVSQWLYRRVLAPVEKL